MKILNVESLAIPDIKVITFGRFNDDRGYFTELFKRNDIDKNDKLGFLKGVEFKQVNESFSKPSTIRGLHFQWKPYMAKLVRTVCGRMVDLVLDIRRGSPTFGKIVAYDMAVENDAGISRWIWVPVGFAHGNYFTKDTVIEYFCTSEWGPGYEAGISPLAPDIDWSICDGKLADEFKTLKKGKIQITEKDRNGFTIKSWLNDSKSDNYVYNKGD